MGSAAERVLREVERLGVLRPRDLDRIGVPREHLLRLYRRGLVDRVDRGLYVLPGGTAGERQTLAEAARRVEHGVVCLLSALRFHELTTQDPSEVWMAIEHKARAPRTAAPPIRVVRMTGAALRAGVEEHHVGGVTIRAFGPAKTVADCFKFRNKIGLDVAIEALRDYRQRFPAGIDELWRYAEVCRVTRVMRPYLEATA